MDTDQNIDTIRKEITAKKTEYRRIVGEMEPINEQKRHCKQQFKAKQLTENEYKGELERLRLLKEPYLQLITNLQLPSNQVLRYLKLNYGIV